MHICTHEHCICVFIGVWTTDSLGSWYINQCSKILDLYLIITCRQWDPGFRNVGIANRGHMLSLLPFVKGRAVWWRKGKDHWSPSKDSSLHCSLRLSDTGHTKHCSWSISPYSLFRTRLRNCDQHTWSADTFCSIQRNQNLIHKIQPSKLYGHLMLNTCLQHYAVNNVWV